MNILQNTFDKHKRLLREQLNLKGRVLKENSKKDSIDKTIKRYRDVKYLVWQRAAKGDFEHMIRNGKITDEFHEYYPGWNIEDIKAVYRGVEGKDYIGSRFGK